MKKSAVVCLAALLLPHGAASMARAPAPSAPIGLVVDATEAPRRILHARLTIPARPGPLTLLYPKWLPGEHGPTGPVADLAGLRFAVGGKPVPWRRDPLDMYAFHVEVPGGATSLEVSLDYLSPTATEGFSSSASAGAQIAVISWNQLLLYPDVEKPGALAYVARLRLPSGWKYATALPVAREGEREVEFVQVPLTTLIDSPVASGVNQRVFPLAPGVTPSHEIDVTADGAAALEMPADLLAGYNRLVDETGALFGARHYRRYRFLLTLSDSLAHFGLEHHESSDNRSFEGALVNPERRRLMLGLLPHEFVHSWNGKYRRPADLTLDDFHRPANTELLWVYEGLTSYLGEVLTARSGLRSPEEARERLAWLAAGLEHTRGRSWRPLVDTAVAAQILYQAPDAWAAWRRGVDFYDEGVMIWLETDAMLRQKSQGRRSLDDFCRRFHGGENGPPAVKTYTFEDVVATLNDVVPYGWRGFLRERLDSTTDRAPLGGIEASGFRVVYDEERPEILKSREEVHDNTDLRFSIGINVQKDGTIIDVIPDLPAAKAGLGPGMKMVAVNGRRWSREKLRGAIKESKTTSSPIELLVENGDFYRTFALDYHGGERYPHLVRDASRPDLLSEIFRPRSASSERTR